ncbi:MAG: ABC transporter ATP-binding protein [Eubacteriales bacterium]|nr:ABC transporter ATP-binding protein [Eubacteriales bacterium]
MSKNTLQETSSRQKKVAVQDKPSKRDKTNAQNKTDTLDKAALKAKNHRRNHRLAGYAWRARKSFLPALTLDGLDTALNLLAPLLVGRILDEQVMRQSQNLAGAGDGLTYYLQLLGLYFLVVLIGAGIGYAGQYLFQYSANNIGRLVQMDVFQHLQKMPLSFFDHMAAGKVVSRVTNDTKALKMLFSQVITRLISAIIFSLGIFISLFFVDRVLFLMALVPLPLLYLVFKDFKRKSSYFSTQSRKEISELNGQLNENIQGMEIIQSLGREDRVRDKFTRLNDQHFQTSFEFTKLFSYSSSNVVGVLNRFSMAAILAYFGYASLQGNTQLPLGSLYVFIEYMRRLFQQFEIVLDRIGGLERSLGAADHIFEILDLPQVQYQEGELAPVQGEIRFEHVNFSYLEGEPVLKNLSFEVKAGASAAFVGATGSGKSTIMNLLAGFYPLDSGDIFVDGQKLEDLPLLELRQQMAIVLQDPFLFSGTLYSNISLDKEDISPAQAEAALREVGGAQLLDRLEKGIMTPVNRQGQGFSAGERQLISFARALAQEPRILILDEATSNVDSATEGMIQQGIERLQEGRTTLLIAHRLSTIRDADTIYVLDKGILKEAGKHADLMSLGGIYAQMYEEQSKSIAS